MKPSSSQSLWSSESVRKVSSRRSASYRFTVNYLVTTSRQSAMRLCFLFNFMGGFTRTSPDLFISPGPRIAGQLKSSYIPVAGYLPFSSFATRLCSLNMKRFVPGRPNFRPQYTPCVGLARSQLLPGGVNKRDSGRNLLGMSTASSGYQKNAARSYSCG